MMPAVRVAARSAASAVTTSPVPPCPAALAPRRVSAALDATPLRPGADRAAADHARQRQLASLRARLLQPATPTGLLWPPRPADGPTTVTLFGLPVTDTTLTAAARDLVTAASARRRLRVAFLNAHAINVAHDDATYADALASATRLYADGSGMAIAARLAGTPLRDNVNGTDLLPVLCREAAAARVGIFLLGAKPGVAAAAGEMLHGLGLGAAIVGSHHGHFADGSAEERAAIAAVTASGAHILLVGLGIPRQDVWAARMADRLATPVVVGVGGLFDFFAGAVPRAPQALRGMGGEWMWRLAMEPRRMARRYLIGNAQFLTRAVRAAVIGHGGAVPQAHARNLSA